MNLSEDALCEIFADAVKDRDDFRLWLLSKTKFFGEASGCRLLHEEQMSIRPRRRWWRHWWCHVPELNKDRETDIFMVFEAAPSQRRFALHIENKRDNYKFSDGQASAYAPRARHMLNDPRFLSHSDFQTILLAPTSFQARYEADAALFDIFISYEETARFLPAFQGTRISN
ncbi:hypothetical protein [Methylobacterium oryzihabitans]|uniref:Uncharacterized protein n=1 Tax=Methylobacterium oryzihabitans TaxID=2499852 RepID=A0A3S2V7F5_9HYPH|nr:hypothetical protein [Methylobacterium oryzihabitans]RVU16216.1 hypothetical protein EOE48_17865 [Methylobacterium oryzihabitans]